MGDRRLSLGLRIAPGENTVFPGYFHRHFYLSVARQNFPEILFGYFYCKTTTFIHGMGMKR
jgi:hypothetical protein